MQRTRNSPKISDGAPYRGFAPNGHETSGLTAGAAAFGFRGRLSGLMVFVVCAVAGIGA